MSFEAKVVYGVKFFDFIDNKEKKKYSKDDATGGEWIVRKTIINGEMIGAEKVSFLEPGAESRIFKGFLKQIQGINDCDCDCKVTPVAEVPVETVVTTDSSETKNDSDANKSESGPE